MTDRATKISAFLADWGYSKWSRRPIAGDASARRYDRLIGPDGATAILMDADPSTNGSMQPFLAMAEHLRGIGLHAPRLYHHDLSFGLAVIEDLGTDQMATVVKQAPDREISLYSAATDVILTIQSTPPPSGLTRLDADRAVGLVREVTEWFPTPLPPETFGTLKSVLEQHCGPADHLALRDYHAENLICRSDGSLALLDFQDAVAAPLVYDLVSLLRDVRRDVSEPAATTAIARFAAAKGTDADQLAPAIAAMGAQRNLRILGIFYRLAKRDGKPGYLAHIPRLKTYLARDLSHPDLRDLNSLVAPMMETLPDHA